MSEAKKVGLFGGTFDPVHSAHIEVANEAARKLQLDKLFLVPAAEPPHKDTVADYEDRYRMVELACEGAERLLPSRLEEGSGPSYSILTIEKLRRQVGDAATIYFLIGADAFDEIRTWHRWKEVVDSVEFIVVTRPGHDYETPDGARVHRLDTTDLPVSSSEIRDKLASGEETPELPEAVRRYIDSHDLYQ